MFKPKKSWLKPLLFIFGGGFAFIAILAGSAMLYARGYADRVYPGVYVGGYHLSGMSYPDLKNFIETLNDKLSKEGQIVQIVENEVVTGTFKLNSILVEGDSTIELFKLDSDKFAQTALSVGRSNQSLVRNLIDPLLVFLIKRDIFAPTILEEQKLDEILRAELSHYENSPHNANVKILNNTTGAYETISDASGEMFDLKEIAGQLSDHLTRLSFVPLAVSTRSFSPTLTSRELVGKQEELASIFSYGGLNINFVDPQTQWRHDWNLSVGQLSDWIEATRVADGKVIFQLNAELVKKYLSDQVSSYIDRPAGDAKFNMVDGRVNEFLASQSGQKLDINRTFEDLNRVFVERNFRPLETAKTVSVIVAVVEPNIKLSNVNDLGIADIIGTGISTFKDSHSNRIKNIANAVGRLNGVIIAPGEEFSAIKYAGPFTSENGFLPEEVIKGDKIQKEIGGGMCQIGTTLFRMAMNSGMPITERHNHSLVVSYYADPVNGNPGTDASLYEPILDLKFINDTGGYLLLQTDIDYHRQQLTFTLWGKPDGRKGWYTHPAVSKWIPAGNPPPPVESATLKPGEIKCQNAFKG
ncbi:MAG: VanW family protein, partial [Candidatus Magasanikbacteria bacterium]